MKFNVKISALIIALTCVAGFYFLEGNNKNSSGKGTKTQEELNQYSSNLGFNLTVPTRYAIVENANSLEISSPKLNCKVKGTEGPFSEINAYHLLFELHENTTYEDAWKTAFGYEFTHENSYDGITEIGGKQAYYFYQGAEMPLGRTAYLVKVDATTSLEINKYTPSYTFECKEGTLDSEQEKTGDLILQNLIFTK